MGTFFGIILDILSILGIIVFGSFIVVVIADLILCMFDDHEGIIFRRNKKNDSKEQRSETNSTINKDEIVVYSSQNNPNGNIKEEKKQEIVDGAVVQEIDYDKAIEEQKALSSKNNGNKIESTSESKKVNVEEKKEEDMFWNVEEDKEFTKLLDDVIAEAKDSDKKVQEVVTIEENRQDDETKKELEELKALKEEQQKEIEEIRKLKEDFAREKEEQLELLKQNLNKAKEEEIERIRQEAILEQEKLEQEKIKLEQEKAKLEEDQIKEVEIPAEKEQIIKETIIKDEEEINKLKYKNLLRMNNRLTRIIRDTEKLKIQKQKEQDKINLEKQKLLEKEQEQKLREQERLQEIQRKNREKLIKQSEALRLKNEISKKLSEVSKKAGKYKLDNKTVKIVKDVEPDHQIIEEVVTTVEETIPGTDTVIKTVEKEPLKASPKPIFAKEYYEQKLIELDNELKEAEKELRINKSEYIPLTRIHKSYVRDSEKLRKKEIQVAKQKVALYGVNSTKIDPAKKAKLDENLQTLAELKDSVEHCEEVIKKNKDRYPVLEKNNKLINKQIERINDDIKVCEKAISYYNKKK